MSGGGKVQTTPRSSATLHDARSDIGPVSTGCLACVTRAWIKTVHTRLSKQAISTDSTHGVDKMGSNHLNSLSHCQCWVIKEWHLGVQQLTQMLQTLTYVPDSDEEQANSCGHKSTGEWGTLHIVAYADSTQWVPSPRPPIRSAHDQRAHPASQLVSDACSKVFHEPNLLFTAKHQKTDLKNDASGKQWVSTPPSLKQRKASMSLMLEELSAKNTACCLSTIKCWQVAPVKQEVGKS